MHFSQRIDLERRFRPFLWLKKNQKLSRYVRCWYGSLARTMRAIQLFTTYVYTLAAVCMCRWQSTFEIHMKTSSLLYSSLATFFFFPDRYLPRPSIGISTNVSGSIQRTRISFHKHSADVNGLPVISFSYEDQSNKQFVMRRLSSHEWCQQNKTTSWSTTWRETKVGCKNV